MERISELLDNVGWSPQYNQREYNAVVFRWMTEATNRIQELEHKVAQLQQGLNTLSACLDQVEGRVQ